MTLQYGTLLLLFLLIFQSCQPQDAAAVQGVEKPFFDLKSYFEQEKNRLAQLSNFTKTTTVDGQTETKKIPRLNLDNEFRIFLESDINRPAWFGKFAIDSSFTADNLSKITYTAQEEDMEIQNVTVDFAQSAVQKISIQKKATTVLADTQFELIYEPDRGYSIENKQQLTVGDDKNFLVTVILP